MIIRKTQLCGFLCFLLMVMFCGDKNPASNDNGEDDKKNPVNNSNIFGTFIVALLEPTLYSPAHTSFQGSLKDGPTPPATNWKEKKSIGECKLVVPFHPYCDECTDGVCIDDDVCQREPDNVYGGKITLKGLKNNKSEKELTLDTLLHNYIFKAGTFLSCPPFEEGDEVSLTAEGCDSVPDFTLTAKGIKPLVVLNDSISLIDDKPVKLKWEPASDPENSVISILVDISQHGTTKGRILCETKDDGSLEIPAELIMDLKKLGIAGFPRIEITRKVSAKCSVTNATLEIVSSVTRIVNIPGLISCDDEEGCPDGYTCEDAMCVKE